MIDRQPGVSVASLDFASYVVGIITLNLSTPAPLTFWALAYLWLLLLWWGVLSYIKWSLCPPNKILWGNLFLSSLSSFSVAFWHFHAALENPGASLNYCYLSKPNIFFLLSRCLYTSFFLYLNYFARVCPSLGLSLILHEFAFVIFVLRFFLTLRVVGFYSIYIYFLYLLSHLSFYKKVLSRWNSHMAELSHLAHTVQQPPVNQTCVTITIKFGTFPSSHKEISNSLTVPPHSCPPSPPQPQATTNLPCLLRFAQSGHFT